MINLFKRWFKKPVDITCYVQAEISDIDNEEYEQFSQFCVALGLYHEYMNADCMDKNPERAQHIFDMSINAFYYGLYDNVTYNHHTDKIYDHFNSLIFDTDADEAKGLIVINCLVYDTNTLDYFLADLT